MHRSLRTAATAASVAVAASAITAGVTAQAHTTQPKPQVLWAVVDDDSPTATVARGQRVLFAGHSGPVGERLVRFDRDVRDCSYTANVGTVGSEPVEPETYGYDPDVVETGFATVRQSPNDDQVVYVRTWDVHGTPALKPFHLQVICRDSTNAQFFGKPVLLDEIEGG